MVSRILITGLSGVGKSTVVKELRERGYIAVDTDDPGWIELRHDGERVWREDRIHTLLDSLSPSDRLILSGTVINQREFYDLFDKVILLSAPRSVISTRLLTRTNNPYGKDPEELEEALEYINTVEPQLRRGADFEIDTNRPLEEVIDLIIGQFEM